MVPVLARMAVIIKADHDTNIITGNYEMAYACGLLCKLSGTLPPSFSDAEEMRSFVLSAMEKYQTEDAREQNLIRMLKIYKQDGNFDEQVQELFRMGLEEKHPWQKLNR